jgi:hypothetical protein
MPQHSHTVEEPRRRDLRCVSRENTQKKRSVCGRSDCYATDLISILPDFLRAPQAAISVRSLCRPLSPSDLLRDICRRGVQRGAVAAAPFPWPIGAKARLSLFGVVGTSVTPSVIFSTQPAVAATSRPGQQRRLTDVRWRLG